MKYIKKFENNEFRYKAQIGDYVLLHLKVNNAEFVPYNIKCAIDYVNTHVGKITSSYRYNWEIRVEFENVPTDIQSYFGKSDKKNTFYRTTTTDNIVAIGKTPEEVEINVQMKKYNL